MTIHFGRSSEREQEKLLRSGGREMTPQEIAVLEQDIERIWQIARDFGLDPYPTHFEIVPPTILYEFGAYLLPGRFSHWTHGRAYQQMKTMYDYGLSKIYELVINTNPCYAFLMESNSLLQNKLIVAHVLAHCDFFKNNAYFQGTQRQMIEAVSVNADRIRQYEYAHGTREVEAFLDAVLSIDEHIDPLQARRARPPTPQSHPAAQPATAYDDLFELEDRAARRATADAAQKKPARRERRKLPPEPEKDMLAFIGQYAPDLEEWQRDIIHMVRAEALYFVPQMQTKILNEGWACATGDSLVLTQHGYIRFDELYQAQQKIAVASGKPGECHGITGFHVERAVPTLRIRTKRGYTIEGAHEHRVRMANGSWKYLCDIQAGDAVALAAGTEIWSDTPVSIHYTPTEPDVDLQIVAHHAGTSIWTVLRHLAGKHTRAATRIDAAIAETGYTQGRAGKVISTRRTLRLPQTLDAPIAEILGYFAGDGNMTKSGICLTSGNEVYARHLCDSITAIFGIPAKLRADHTATSSRWRIEVHSRELMQVLQLLGIDLCARARTKSVPQSVLRSPRAVVAAFLRGYFDADAYAGPEGIILSSASSNLIQTVQTLLLNFGIIATQRVQPDGCTQLAIRGASAMRFMSQIGFGLAYKQAALEVYVGNHRWYKREEVADSIVEIIASTADVYDITVDVAHTYVANGLLHHNSFWHSRIMRELDLPSDEYAEYAAMHAGVLAPSRRSINPYYVGYKMFEDIERRWDALDGSGRARMFEVREIESDTSFLRNYLTEELVEELDLYIYKQSGDRLVIVEKDWRKVRDTLVNSMTNFGQPYIVVEDGDYRGARELYLKHVFDTRELDMNYARKTLAHIYTLWGRTVHLETQQIGERVLLSFDGEKHHEKTL